ncbi:MAG: DUF2628 domain-containing protein [Clostridia bacterium]|nr:DUF2628 domain-containing protein [Clostridia bacterium]
MSLNEQNQSCALCHAYLFAEDDVVYCPECGAPHHRECYNKLNKCALEELHGTENQYDKLKKAAEDKQANEESKQFETAETDYETPFGMLSPIDFLGGVKPEDEIDNGVTANEAAKFVVSNTMRYIPKFKKLNKYNKASWNFLAFLLPSGWFFSRKMYLNGIITGAIEIIATLLTVPFQLTCYNLGLSGMMFEPQTLQKMAENMDKFPPIILYVAFIGSILSIVISIVVGILGDYLYKKHAVNTIREIKEKSENKETDFRKKGGVNIFMFLIGVMAVQYIPAIIVSLIG